MTTPRIRLHRALAGRGRARRRHADAIRQRAADRRAAERHPLELPLRFHVEMLGRHAGRQRRPHLPAEERRQPVARLQDGGERDHPGARAGRSQARAGRPGARGGRRGPAQPPRLPRRPPPASRSARRILHVAPQPAPSAAAAEKAVDAAGSTPVQQAGPRQRRSDKHLPPRVRQQPRLHPAGSGAAGRLAQRSPSRAGLPTSLARSAMRAAAAGPGAGRDTPVQRAGAIPR